MPGTVSLDSIPRWFRFEASFAGTQKTGLAISFCFSRHFELSGIAGIAAALVSQFKKEGHIVKKKRVTRTKAVRNLPSKSVSPKRGKDVRGGGTPQPYLQFNLKDALVSSYSVGGGGGDKK